MQVCTVENLKNELQIVQVFCKFFDCWQISFSFCAMFPSKYPLRLLNTKFINNVHMPKASNRWPQEEVRMPFRTAILPFETISYLSTGASIFRLFSSCNLFPRQIHIFFWQYRNARSDASFQSVLTEFIQSFSPIQAIKHHF